MPSGVRRQPQAREFVLTKKCSDCKESKPWAEFPPREYWPDGSVRLVMSVCHRCGTIRSIRLKRKRMKNDPVYRANVRNYHKAWQARRREQLRKEAAGLHNRLPVGPLREWLAERLAIGEEHVEEFAARCGVSARAIGRILRDHEHVTMDLADKILIANGVLLNDLYPLDDERIAA